MADAPRLLTLAALVALLAGGCAVRDDGEPAGAATRPAETRFALAWGVDPLESPRGLDPAFASESGANVLLNVMDPLVRLDRELTLQPALAVGWKVAADGRTITFALREDGRWTNGDAVTAHDFEFAWKRALSPDLEATNAEELYGIRGARAYHACELDDCAALAERVGVRALDARTLRVRLAAPDPSFAVRVAHVAFLAVHPASVNDLGVDWTEPDSLVTNGPFRIEAAETGRSLVLAKDPDWRDAAAVTVGRVDGRIIEDPLTRIQAFDQGEVIALDGTGLPASEMPALRERAEYERYPALATYAYAFNLDTVTDVHQRRALALAIDRAAILEQVGRGDEIPAIGFTPPAMPGFDQILSASPWMFEDADLDAARAELVLARDVADELDLAYVESSVNTYVAEEVRRAWGALGIDVRLHATTDPDALQAASGEIDVSEVSWRYTVADPAEGLLAWTCGDERNSAGYCDRRFDRAVRAALRETDAAARNDRFAAAEARLFGAEGSVPLAPIYWNGRSNLEALAIKESFFVNPLGQIDLTNVQLR